MAMRISDVPRSPPRSTRASTSVDTGMRGTTRWRICESIRVFRVRTSAPQMMRANLAASAGCSRKPPRSIQFWLPCTLTPMPGTSTSTSSTIVMISAGIASRRQNTTGSREAMRNSGTPMSAHIACFCAIARDDPLAA